MARAPIPRQYLNLAEACEYTGMSRDTLTGHIRDGALPAFKASDARSAVVRVKVADLDALIESWRVAG